MYIFSVLTTLFNFFWQKTDNAFFALSVFFTVIVSIQADLLSYSGDYLNRIAKKYTGMTLFEYRTTFSIRKAEFI